MKATIQEVRCQSSFSDANGHEAPSIGLMLVLLAVMWVGVLLWGKAPAKVREWPRVIGGILVLAGGLMLVSDLLRLVFGR